MLRRRMFPRPMRFRRTLLRRRHRRRPQHHSTALHTAFSIRVDRSTKLQRLAHTAHRRLASTGTTLRRPLLLRGRPRRRMARHGRATAHRRRRTMRRRRTRRSAMAQRPIGALRPRLKPTQRRSSTMPRLRRRLWQHITLLLLLSSHTHCRPQPRRAASEAHWRHICRCEHHSRSSNA
jgi:hypothetical protein